MTKSFITKATVAGLIALICVAVLPATIGAQVAYYSGYNARPYWNRIPTSSVVQGQSMSFVVTAIDENGDPLTYASVQLPAGANFNPVTRVFNFTPSFTQLGSFPAMLSVTDGKSAPVPVTFYVNVTTDYGHYVYGGGDAYGYYNQAPYFTSTNSYYTATSGSYLRFTVTAVDPEGQSIRYSVSNLPAGASFDAVDRVFTWTPAAGQRGTYTLNFYATDGAATSVPLAVIIVVDGGNAVGTGSTYYYPSQNQNAYTAPVTTAYPYQYSNPVSNYYPYQQYSNIGNCQFSVAPTTAVAGQTYVYAVRACDPNGLAVKYTLSVAPAGAVIDGQSGLLTWAVPANAANQSYQFLVFATNSYGTVLHDNFAVNVQGGTGAVTTIATAPKTIVRYIQTPAPAPAAAPAYYPSNNQQTVSVSAGRVVVPTNYPYYAATAYGAFAPATASIVPITAFNIAVRVNTLKEMVVSWDTNKPTSGEVVFGYASQSRGADLDRTILNYDFRTGQSSATATRHEASLGQLEANRTYYLRVISRADNQTDISREIVFIPMPTPEGQIIINQSEGAASALSTLGSFLTGGGFLFFLLLIVLGLIVYLIMLSRRPAYEGSDELHSEPHLHITPEKHR